MTSRHIFARGLIAACTLLASASCGRAATNQSEGAECAWQKVPAEHRRALLDAYSSQGSDGLGAVQIDDSTIRMVAKACKSKDMDAARLSMVSVAIAGAAMRHGAEQGLRAKGVHIERLDKVWRTTTVQKNALIESVRNPDRSPEGAKLLFGEVADLTRLAGGSVPTEPDATSDPTFRLYADYFIGRTLEEGASAGMMR